MYYILSISCKGVMDRDKFEILDCCESEEEAIDKMCDLAANLFGYRDYDELCKNWSYDWMSSAFRNGRREFDYFYVEDDEQRNIVEREFFKYQMKILEFIKK